MSSFLSDPDLPQQSLMLAKQRRKKRDWACRTSGLRGPHVGWILGPSSGSQEQESWTGTGPMLERGPQGWASGRDRYRERSADAGS